ncbi:Probable Co/Zn/Cd efflux system membrane fusion protein [hydrothermal vent metagenome]|uniref:Probable Co/Zn/Cd efflux system membrane fusion protein n=1 Tax=hydrothermal vent metagenome TaxID=652676 RepID=A0A3B0YTP8_9ZZZZ
MRYTHLLILLFALGAGKTALAADDGHEHEEAGHKHEKTEPKEAEGGHEEKEGHGHEEAEGGHEEGGHGHGGHEEEEGAVELTAGQIEAAGIETLLVEHGEIAGVVTAPGEVGLNAYQTTKVAPRIAAQIVKRHVQLGESVTPGQVLVTLSSVEVAKAQGELLVSDREWQRVKKLGRKVVSERRYIEAQVARQQAEAILRAFGMSSVQINALLQNNSSSSASGELELLSPQDGTVISDDFIVGELAEPGRELFVITNENNLWVDARLTPEDAANVYIGSKARIKTRKHWLDGEVIQAQHMLDEATRTLSVRLRVANANDELHPGEFVTVEIESSNRQAGIAIPVAAVLRSPDGDWQVFIEASTGRFEPKEVEVQRTVGNRMVVEGLKAGERIVSKGAFFIQSEIAKGGFDIHNH